MKCVGAYEVLRQVLKLTHYKDNLYRDTKKETYVLDKYGFHLAIRYRYTEASKLERLIEDTKEAHAIAISTKAKYRNLISNVISKNKVNYIIKILNNESTSDAYKIISIREYLKPLIYEENNNNAIQQ